MRLRALRQIMLTPTKRVLRGEVFNSKKPLADRYVRLGLAVPAGPAPKPEPTPEN